MPRLCHFRTLHPEFEVHLSATERVVDFGRDAVDAAICYGDVSWPDLDTDYLLPADKKPLCSPDLKPLRRPEDLAHNTLLHTIHMQMTGASGCMRLALRVLIRRVGCVLNRPR